MYWFRCACGILKARFYSDPTFQYSSCKSFCPWWHELAQRLLTWCLSFSDLALIHFLQVCFLLLISEPVWRSQTTSWPSAHCKHLLTHTLHYNPLTDGDGAPELILTWCCCEGWQVKRLCRLRATQPATFSPLISPTCSQGLMEKATCQRTYLSTRK